MNMISVKHDIHLHAVWVLGLLHHLAGPGVAYPDLAQGEGVVRAQHHLAANQKWALRSRDPPPPITAHPVLAHDGQQQLQRRVVVHQGVRPELAQEVAGRHRAVRGAQVRPALGGQNTRKNPI